MTTPDVTEERDGAPDEVIGIGTPGTIGHGAGWGSSSEDEEFDDLALLEEIIVTGSRNTPDAADAEALRSVLMSLGIEAPEGARAAELEEIFNSAMGLEEMAPAAGGGSYSHCQAYLDDPGTINLICEMFREPSDAGDLKTAKIPAGNNLEETLTRLAVQVGGGREKVEVGRPDATLCVWNPGPDLNLGDQIYFSECMPWEEPLKAMADAGAGGFDSGRVAHQAPNEMVVDQAYLLEIAIQPLTSTMTVEAADSVLTSTLGTGLAPGSTETPFAIEFDTVKASKVMSATLEGDEDEFEIKALTPKEQAVLPDAPTVWQWRVVPKEDGYGTLLYNMSQSLEVDGERYERSVKRIWQDVDIYTIDELLEDEDETPMAGARTVNLMANTLVAPTPPPSDAPMPAMDSAVTAGCTWTDGIDPDRFAMVLSNLAYNAPISRLSETHEDGDRIAKSLTETGFSVQRCRDVGRAETLNGLREVGRKSLARKQAGAHPTTFFYYSGHGVNVDSTNYVLPVDLPGASEYEIEDGAVSFEQIFNIVSTAVASTSFIVFDACRTVMDDESRGMLRSYAPVTWSTGVFQAYATEPGKTAADDGAYSEELAKRMPSESVPANVLFKRVQDAVARRTNQKQHPNYIDLTTGGDFYFQPE